jgi:hypothetical protein
MTLRCWKFGSQLPTTGPRKHGIFKGLSKDGGWADIAKNLRTSSFNEGISFNTISTTLQGKSHLCISFLELRGLNPNFYNHVSMSDLCMYFQDRSTYFPAAE